MSIFHNFTKLALTEVCNFQLGHSLLNGLSKICVSRIGGMGAGMVSSAGPARQWEVRVYATGVRETMGLLRVE